MDDQATSPNESDNSTETPTVRISHENPYYWSIDGEPTLLIGGSPKDNLYQHIANPDIDIEEALDALVDCGGNYVRHTMQSRVNADDEDFIVQAFGKTTDGRYDLETWNEEYWDRLDLLFEWTAERGIVVQLTFWDRFDFADHTYPTYREYNPWNPANNVTYTSEETGLPTEWDRHPVALIHRFMLAVEDDNTALLPYQERYVEKILEHTLAYDHILYNVSNETRAPKSWGDYWADLTKERAAEIGSEPVYVTQMYDPWDITDTMHNRTHEDQVTYDYVDVSQNNQLSGQMHYDNLVTVRKEFEERRWPVNNVKCYGRDGGVHGATRDGLERFWRSLFGGSASIRFHRPPSGIGIGDLAQTHIQAARDVTNEIDIINAEPQPYLLSDRTENEAYCLADGKRILVFFTDGGSVRLTVDEYQPATVRWYDVSEPGWDGEEAVGSNCDSIRLDVPDDDYWVAVVA